jgi:hypothetical protein
MTSALITNTVQALIAHHADDAGRAAVYQTALDIFNQYTPAVRKHGNRWFLEMVDADGVTFNDTYGHIFSRTVALYGNFYKTKREASTHTLTNKELRDFLDCCVIVAWELVW